MDGGAVSAVLMSMRARKASRVGGGTSRNGRMRLTTLRTSLLGMMRNLGMCRLESQEDGCSWLDITSCMNTIAKGT